MTSHRSVPGFWGAEPHPAVLPEEIGLAWGVPPKPSATVGLGVSGGFMGVPHTSPCSQSPSQVPSWV